MKEEKIMNLKWQSFPSHLAGLMDTCYEKQQFVDVSLVCKDGTIVKCHKMVLANSSTFFQRLLLANDHPHPMIVLHDVESDELKTIINFMYSGEIQVVKSEVRRLLKLAEIFQVSGLRNIQSNPNIDELCGPENSPSKAPKQNSNPQQWAKIDDARSQKKPVQSAQNDQDFNQRVTRSQGKVLPSIQSPQKNSINKSTLDSPKKPENSQNLPGTSKAHLNAFESEPTGRSGISIVSPQHLMPSKTNKIVIRGKSEDSVKVSQKGNVSVIDIDVPCSNTQNSSNQPRKRRNPRENVNWNTVFSTLSKNDASFVKKRCLMEEVEISLGNSLDSPPQSSVGNSLEPPPLSIIPLDRRKSAINLQNNTSKCPIMIKDEIDIPPEIEVESLDVEIIE